LRNQQLLGNANESPINPHEQSPLHAETIHPQAPDEGARMTAYRAFVENYNLCVNEPQRQSRRETAERRSSHDGWRGRKLALDDFVTHAVREIGATHDVENCSR
jgi:hypothetical protein